MSLNILPLSINLCTIIIMLPLAVVAKIQFSNRIRLPQLAGVLLIALATIGSTLVGIHTVTSSPDSHSATSCTEVTCDWRTFIDSRFDLQFKYPKTVSDGSLVQVKEYGHNNEIQMLFTSEDVNELYFEVTKIPNASALGRYELLKKAGEERSYDLYIGAVKETLVSNYLAFEFTVNSRGEEASVISIQKDKDVYQILFNKHSITESIVAEILQTVKFSSSSI